MRHIFKVRAAASEFSFAQRSSLRKPYHFAFQSLLLKDLFTRISQLSLNNIWVHIMDPVSCPDTFTGTECTAS